MDDFYNAIEDFAKQFYKDKDRYYSQSMNKKVIHKFSNDKSLIKAHTVVVIIA